VNPRDLLVASVARSERVLQQPGGPQILGNGRDPFGPLGMDDVAQMIPVEGIDDELQPECLAAAGLHGLDAAF
jgi:hypothetical protein